MQLSILMPVFNERDTVATAVRAVLDADLPVTGYELILIDDGSTDGTGQLVAEGAWPEQVRVIAHDRNRGKGAAIRTGLAEARGTYTAIMDADLEYDPQDIGKLLEPFRDGGADAVFGVRGFDLDAGYSLLYAVGNRVVTLATNLLFRSDIGDLMTCQKVARTDLLRSLDLREDGFAIEAEIMARLLRGGNRINEAPVAYRARTRTQGKKLTALDGLRVIRTLIRCRIDRRAIRSPA